MNDDDFEIDDYSISIWGPFDKHVIIPLPVWLGTMAEGTSKGSLGAREAIAEFTKEPLREVYSSDLEPSGENIVVRRSIQH